MPEFVRLNRLGRLVVAASCVACVAFVADAGVVLAAARGAPDVARPAVKGASAPFHLHLEKSEPAQDASLATPPTVIRLWFSQPPELAVTSVRLTRADGGTVAVSKPRRGNGEKDPVEVNVAGALPAGRYTVAWKTSSKDGHPVRGEFGFSVKAGA